jgi:hypothetical protein
VTAVSMRACVRALSETVNAPPQAVNNCQKRVRVLLARACYVFFGSMVSVRSHSFDGRVTPAGALSSQL